MSRIRLSDADRERLGCPEWLDIDVAKLSTEEGEQIELAGGEFGSYWQGGAVGIKTRVWVGLLRAGCAPEKFADLTFNLATLDFERDPGKAPSATSGKPTRTRSGATRTGKSTPKSNAAS